MTTKPAIAPDFLHLNAAVISGSPPLTNHSSKPGQAIGLGASINFNSGWAAASPKVVSGVAFGSVATRNLPRNRQYAHTPCLQPPDAQLSMPNWQCERDFEGMTNCRQDLVQSGTTPSTSGTPVPRWAKHNRSQKVCHVSIFIGPAPTVLPQMKTQRGKGMRFSVGNQGTIRLK